MSNWFKKSIIMITVAILSINTALFTGGCEEDSGIEEAGEKTGEKMEDVGEEAEDVVE